MENLYVVTCHYYEREVINADPITSTEVFTDLEKANKFFERGLAIYPFLETPEWFHHKENRFASGIHYRSDSREYQYRLFLMRKSPNPEPDKFFF